ncbi:MAG: hypothetical protein N838_07450 [Thiohalocapsa sp. PB-PSB1]|nr:MAG: hypothetical protein N838_07450 [Thiohalocapsa sp. PB-PSB1]
MKAQAQPIAQHIGLLKQFDGDAASGETLGITDQQPGLARALGDDVRESTLRRSADEQDLAAALRQASVARADLNRASGDGFRLANEHAKRVPHTRVRNDADEKRGLGTVVRPLDKVGEAVDEGDLERVERVLRREGGDS